jgi:transcriptional regulator with AAA-type ATPase domain
MRILLSFVGSQDPYSLKRPNDGKRPGPLMNVVREREFEKVALFHTRDEESAKRAVNTAIELKNLRCELDPIVIPLEIDDPTNYEQILRELRPRLDDIKNRYAQATFFISVTSGTPAMHTCWILLAAAGEIPANVLYIRPAQFIAIGQSAIIEINPRAPEFPRIVPRIGMVDLPGVDDSVIQEARHQSGIIGEDKTLEDALNLSIKYASSDFPVLITGESGTGKELFARFIYLASKRRDRDFIPVNCSAIASSLMESELFGHVKGAFTGANRDKLGLFERANGGTIFLDEIGEMPLEMQAKLLRTLQSGEIRQVGSLETRRVDVRIIAATNRRLADAIRDGMFREDLYQRLNVLKLQLPSLRERRGDILLIASQTLEQLNRSHDKTITFSPDAANKLLRYSWPGNVRELSGVVKRAFVVSCSDIISAEDIILDDTVAKDSSFVIPELGNGFSLNDYLASVREAIYQEALSRAGSQAGAARLLGVSSESVRKSKARAS